MAKTIGWIKTGWKTTAIALLFTLLLVPSAWFAWQNRRMPQFGQAHDDAIYYIASKSLADGQGYRISSLPQMPYETKYPPLLPWLLSIAWIIQPKFPENLAIATAIQWAMIPPFLWLCAAWFRRVGLSEPYRWLAVALLAIQPYTVMFAAGIFTETLYAGFLLGSLIALDKARQRVDGSRWAAFAGALAGIGYLARSAGVVAIVSGPLVFLIWKKRREALAFFLGMIPMVVGWMAWARIHQSSSTDFISLYNTNYLGFQLANVHWNDLGTVAWTNLAHMLYEMGALLFPLEDASFFLQLLRDTVGDRYHLALVLPASRSRAATVLVVRRAQRRGTAGLALPSQPAADVSAGSAIRSRLDLGKPASRPDDPAVSDAPRSQPARGRVDHRGRGVRRRALRALDAGLHDVSRAARATRTNETNRRNAPRRIAGSASTWIRIST